MSLRRPRRKHVEADEEQQRKFKEEVLPEKIEELAKEHPNDTIEVWGEDEHRLGLQPIIRAVWVAKGSKDVTIPVNPKYEWFYLYAFVHPPSGRSYWRILPYLNIEMFSMVLKDFAEEFGAGRGKQLLLVVDQASWHTSPNLKIPEGIHFAELPVKSPELQPVERLWMYSDETVANKAWGDIEAMMDETWNRCQYLMTQTDFISGVTNYHWWPKDVVPISGY